MFNSVYHYLSNGLHKYCQCCSLDINKIYKYIYVSKSINLFNMYDCKMVFGNILSHTL